MSPLLDIQVSLRRLGKIRIGDQQATKSGKTRPAKLTEFRLTSPSADLLESAAAIYGGTVAEWEGAPGEGKQYELYTTADSLDVIIPPGEAAFSQFYEMWSGGGCQRRCDGRTEQLSGDACMCPSDQDERAAAAAKGKACKMTSRLSVILPRVPDIGTWMLETHGYYAAVELAGSMEVLRMAAETNRLIPARLRIDQRTAKRDGETRHYIVPVIELPTLTLGTLTTGEAPPAIGNGRAALPGGSEPTGPPPPAVASAGIQSPPPKLAAPPSQFRKDLERSASPPPPPLPSDKPPDELRQQLREAIDSLTEAEKGIALGRAKAAKIPNVDGPQFTLAHAEKLVFILRCAKAIAACAAVDVTSDDGRHELIKLATGGETSSSKSLTSAQLSAVVAYCDRLATETAEAEAEDAGRPFV